MSGRLFSIVALTPAFLIVAAAAAGVRLNTSVSMPQGLYVRWPSGPLVEFCPPGDGSRISMERGYRHAGSCPDGGAPLLKPVIAGEADQVTVTDQGIVVNGRLAPRTAPLARDSQGRQLTYYRGSGRGLWVASGYDRRSFDSRYFGPIEVGAVNSHARPLWVLE
jgi:conjugative transfer signal peptidase TraF